MTNAINTAAALKITAMQESVLRSFPGYDNPFDTKGDLGSSWTDAKELAAVSGLTVKQVQGVLSGLSKRGLVHADEEGANGSKQVLQCLSEEGCDVLAALMGITDEEVEQGAPLPAQVFVTKIVPHHYAQAEQSTFAAMFLAAGGDQPRMMYKAQKAVAAAWTGTREEFIAQSLAYGIIRRTTVINWKEGRA